MAHRGPAVFGNRTLPSRCGRPTNIRTCGKGASEKPHRRISGRADRSRSMLRRRCLRAGHWPEPAACPVERRAAEAAPTATKACAPTEPCAPRARCGSSATTTSSTSGRSTAATPPGTAAYKPGTQAHITAGDIESTSGAVSGQVIRPPRLANRPLGVLLGSSGSTYNHDLWPGQG